MNTSNSFRKLLKSKYNKIVKYQEKLNNDLENIIAEKFFNHSQIEILHFNHDAYEMLKIYDEVVKILISRYY